ncbi:MAG: histidine phosphatase family protein [Bacillota bacterium]
MMTNVYLVRHGESEWNIHNKVQGKTDIELSKKGIKQAELLAERLEKENIEHIYTSDLKRAKKTAELIQRRIGIDPVEMEIYREIGLGPWEGLTIAEIKENYNEHYRIYREEPASFILPGAETILEVADRVCRGILDIVSRHKNSNILVVSHGVAIKSAVIKILDIDISKYNRFRIDNASITILSFSDVYSGGVVVNTLNDISHLI